jgi:hypothetical protein
VPETRVFPCVNNFMRLDLVDEEARCVARAKVDVGEGRPPCPTVSRFHCQPGHDKRTQIDGAYIDI